MSSEGFPRYRMKATDAREGLQTGLHRTHRPQYYVLDTGRLHLVTYVVKPVCIADSLKRVS